MGKDVFISHSSSNRDIADIVCSELEKQDIMCWMAPRDITPGIPFGEAIINGIEECSILLLIFSSSSNDSPQVQREVERAVSKSKILIPVRIENIIPTKSMEFALCNIHWFDAFPPPFEKHVARLIHSIKIQLGRNENNIKTPKEYYTQKSRGNRVYLLKGEKLFINTDPVMENSRRFLPGTSFDVISTEKTFEEWHLLAKGHSGQFWIRGDKVTHKDPRTFFRNDKLNSVGYLASSVWKDLSGGDLELLNITDTSLGDISLKIESIAKFKTGNNNPGANFKIDLNNGRSYSGAVIQDSIAGIRTCLFYICPDVVINLSNQFNSIIPFYAAEDEMGSSHPTVKSFVNTSFKIVGSSALGCFDCPDNYLHFTDIFWGEILINLDRVESIDLDSNRDKDKVIITTVDKNVFAGTANATFTSGSFSLKLNSSDTVILEAER